MKEVGIKFTKQNVNIPIVYTYIQSRFYRSPEVILGIPYTTQIDMWSFGCMLPELLTGIFLIFFYVFIIEVTNFLLGKPIFPGETEIDQLSCIMEVFGLPPKAMMNKATRKRLFFGMIILKFINNFFNYFVSFFITLK